MRARRPAFVSLVLLGLVLVPACNPAFYRPHRNWSSFSTKNVTLYSDANHIHAHSQEELETAYTAFSGSFFRHLPQQKAEVLFLQYDPGRFGKLYGLRADPPTAWSLETVPTGTGIGRDGLIIVRTLNSRSAALQLAYQFVFRAFPRAPIWFQIGFAQYIATYRVHYRGDETVTCYGADRGLAAVRGLEWTASSGTANVLMWVWDVVDMDWYTLSHNGRKWAAFTSFAMISFFVHGGNGLNKARFPHFLNAMSRGLDIDEALAVAYPYLLSDELDDAVRDFAYGTKRPLDGSGTVLNGMCFTVPSVRYRTNPAVKAAVPESAIKDVFANIEALPLWSGHLSFYPQDVVQAEAAKRGLGPGGNGAGAGTGAGSGGAGPGGAGDRRSDGTATGKPRPPRPPRAPKVDVEIENDKAP